MDACNNIKVIQLNAARRHTTHELLMSWLSNQDEEVIVCLQEPLVTKKGLSRLPSRYEAFWSLSEGDKQCRTAIIAPKGLNGYMVSQSSSKDCIIVRFACLHVSFISMYMDINMSVCEPMRGVHEEHFNGRKVITCVDTNAHSVIWGAMGNRQNRFRAYKRGDEILDILNEFDMCVCNITPHAPTYIGETGNKTHIDAIFCSSAIISRIHGWQVLYEQLDSDHRVISFHVLSKNRNSFNAESAINEVLWRRPSESLNKRMHACLPRMVTYRRRICSEIDVSTFVQRHTNEVQEALRRLSKGSKQGQRGTCYWWNDEVSMVHRQMRKAGRRLGRYGHKNLREEYNACRQAFRKKVREAKIRSWQTFTSQIADPWKGLMNILKRLNINKSMNRTLCDANGEYAEDLQSTLHLLGRQFYPAPTELTNAQKEIEKQVEKRLQQANSGEEITLCEFRKAIREMTKATAPGEDNITNSVLQILVKQCKYEKMYIQLFSACLRLGFFPAEWKIAKIMLIPKPSSILDSVKALRPISLTSVFSKLLERIVLARILHYIEMSGNLALSQHAYRKGGSTTTALYETAKFVQETVKDKHVCVMVFLDISGAFDRTWHGGILNRLLQYGVPEYLVKWTKVFLTERTAHFSIAGEEHSMQLHQGCPQGGVLSPVLWNVLFNDMLVLKTRANQDFHLRVVGYADDAVVLCRAKTVKNASVILTNHLVKIKQWADENRVQFNTSKLNVLTVNRNFVKSPAAVYYDGQLIREVTQYKYLGVIFDNRLTWKPHVNSVLEKLAGVTRMLRGAVRESWGVKMSIMRMIFKSVFCPILLYGVAIWGWRMTGTTLCVKFDRVIRHFCIMSTRCLRTTSNEVLFRLMKTSNFSILMKQEVLRVALLQLNLAKCEKDHVYAKENMIHRTSPTSMKHFFYMCKQGLDPDSTQTVYENLLDYYSTNPSEWALTNTCVQSKTETMWEGARREGWVIYTDAFVSSYGAGWAYAAYHHGFCMNMQNAALTRCSIFTAEAQAIKHAVQYALGIQGLSQKEIVEIRSDSQAVVKALEHTVIVDPMLREPKEALKLAKKKGINVVLRWIPSHIGNEGNETVDQYAKKAVDSTLCCTAMTVKRDLKSLIKKRNQVMTERQWNKVESTIPKMFFPDSSCFDAFLKCSPSSELYQLVTGHCKLNDFLCKKMGVIDSPLCACNDGDETVVHFLFVCPLYKQIRSEIWDVSQLTAENIRQDWSKVDEFIKRTKRFEVTQ